MNDQESYDALQREYHYATTAVDLLAAERDEARAQVAEANNRAQVFLLERDEARADLADVREIFPEVLDALHSGGCTPDASIEFLRQIPGEIRMVARKQRLDLDRAIAERNAALGALRFIERWGGRSAGGVDATGAWCAEQARSAICANSAGQTPAAKKEDCHE